MAERAARRAEEPRRALHDYRHTWTLPPRNDVPPPDAHTLPPAAAENDEALLRAAREAQTPPADGWVRVAAVQVFSRMGHVAANRVWLARNIRLAAAAGARIAVLPEAAVPGLADLERGIFWTRDATQADTLRWPLARVAEARDGPSERFFGALAKELGMYLAVPYIEVDGDAYYSAATLLDPSGTAVLRARKAVVATGDFDVDGDWATPGDLPPAAVDTPYGKIGLLIRLDAFNGKNRAALHALGVDLVLNPTSLEGVAHPGAWLGGAEFWQRMGASRARTSWVVANWAAPDWVTWSGHGASRIFSWRGELYGGGAHESGECVVIGDVPTRRLRDAPPPTPNPHAASDDTPDDVDTPRRTSPSPPPPAESKEQP